LLFIDRLLWIRPLLYFHLITLLGDHHTLLSDSSHHVERPLGTAVQRDLFGVVLHALLDHLTQMLLNVKKSVGRTDPLDPLVRPLMIVIANPETDPFPCFLQPLKARMAEELIPDALPEPLHFAQRLRMMGRTANVMDPITLQFFRELALPAPTGILPPVVRQHLPRHSVFGYRATVCLDDLLGPLASEQSPADNVSGMIVQEGDQVGVALKQPKREDIALPELVRLGPFEVLDLRLGLPPLPLRLGRQVLFFQRPADGLRRCLDPKQPLEYLADPLGTIGRMVLLDPRDFLFHRRRHVRSALMSVSRLQPRFAVLAVPPRPVEYAGFRYPRFLLNQR
jgi:hypothetical protein